MSSQARSEDTWLVTQWPIKTKYWHVGDSLLSCNKKKAVEITWRRNNVCWMSAYQNFGRNTCFLYSFSSHLRSTLLPRGQFRNLEPLMLIINASVYHSSGVSKWLVIFFASNPCYSDRWGSLLCLYRYNDKEQSSRRPSFSARYINGSQLSTCSCLL